MPNLRPRIRAQGGVGKFRHDFPIMTHCFRMGSFDMEMGRWFKRTVKQSSVAVGVDIPTMGHVKLAAIPVGPERPDLFKLPDTVNLDNQTGFA